MPDYRKLSEIADEAASLRAGAAPVPPVEPETTAPEVPATPKPLSEIAQEADSIRGTESITAATPPSGVNLATALPKEMAPATIGEQVTRGVLPYEPVDTTKLTEDQRDLYGALQEKLRLENRESETSKVFYGMVEGMKHPRAKEDRGALTGPLLGATAIPEAMRGAEPGSLTQEAGAAFAQKDYTGTGGHYYRVAKTPDQRNIARSVLRNDYIKSGMDADTADLRSRAKYESGAILLLPGDDHPDMAGGAETLEAKPITLKNSWMQAGTDIAVGTAEALGNVADIGKYALNVPAEIGRGGANLVGLHVTDEIVDQFTAWNMPSPSEVARDYLRSTDNPTAKAAAERIDSALRRGAGVMAGFAELHNVAGQAILPQALADWTKIDPNDEDGLGDAIVNVATARHDSPEPRKTAKQLVGETASRTVGMAGELPGRIVKSYEEAATGTKSPLDIGMENMAWGAQVVSTPVMDVMGALSTDATGKEGALGWLFRVPATAASGLITTQVARMADYGAQHLLGAESYRRHRVPGDPDMTAAEAVLPVIFTGSGLHDWLHSIYNGDSLTSEFMRFANTMAYGAPGLSDEWRARWAPGGSLRDAGIQLAMLGDLALPLDAAPHVGVGVVHGASRFTNGYRAGRAGGMTKGEAASLGAAGAVPSLTHRYMMADPEYAAVWTELGNEVMTAQRAALLEQGRPITEAKDVFRPDADAVYTATARAYARRFIENGGNPTNSLSTGRAGGNVAQRVKEMLTTLRVKADDVDAAARAESVAAGSHADPITRRTTATLTTMGYTADDIGHMSESEARRRIDEGVFPGDVDGSSLDPERPPAIREIERAADNLHRVARAEDAPPPGRWSEEVSKEADPYHRAGLALGQLSAYWGLPEDSVLTFRALQTAMSFYDRKRGQYRRSPLPTPTWIAERFRAGKGDHVEMGLRILRDASPKQVWRNVLAFERGETVAWTNDVRADGEATLISRKIPADPSDKNIRAWLPAEHPLVQALVEGETGGVVNTYQRIGNAGRDWLAAVAEDVRGLRSAWKGTYEQAANFYRTRAPAAGLDPLIPPSTDVRTRLAALVGRVEGRDVVALDSFMRRLDERQTSLARGQAIFDAAARWLAARMEEARPKTHGGPGAISHRQRVRSDLVKLVKEKKVAATLKQIDLYLAVFDRVAARLAALKVVESPDAWWARFDITGADVEGAKGSVSFINDGRALITLAADADLSTLFHEGAHLVRRILPAEHMADIDAYVHERWGADGWNATDANGVKVAEEWFARQMESVFAEGRLHLDVRDPLSAGGRLLARVNRALRLVANVLTSIYQGLPIEVEPRMRQWVADFLKVDVAKDRIVGPEGDGLVVEDVPAEWLATVERQAGESAAQAQARIDAAYAARTERRTDAMRDRDFLVREYPALVDGVEAAARGEERARPAERVVPTVVRAEPPTPEDLAGPKFPAVSRTGWGPRMLEEVAADAERIRAIEDPKARNAAVQDWLSAVHGYIGSDKAEGSARHRLAARIGMAVVDQMLNAGRRIVSEMTDAERSAADVALPVAKAEKLAKQVPLPKVDQNDLLVAGKLPANPEAGTVVVDAGPVETPPPASTEVAVAKPVKPSKVQTALAKAGEAFVEKMRYRAGTTDALRTADNVVKAVAKRVAELNGESAPDPKSSVGYLGQPATGFIQGVKDALVNLTDERLGRDGGDLRDARARELAEDFYRRTIAPLEPTPAPVHKPSPLPDILVDVGEPRVVEIPPGVDKDHLIAATVPPHGSPHMDEAGFPRAMTDEKGFAYNYRIARMKLGDLFTSHTPGLAWREGYDHAFQNRPDAFQRAGWIEKVAQTFNADSAARPNGDTPTMGAVTVWVDPQGRNVVVAGNGRSLAMVELHRRGMAGEAPYAGLLAQLQERTGGWSRALGMGEAGGDEIMVRVLDGATYEEAVRFAQNSQGVPSVPVADSAVVTGTAQKLRIANPNRKVAVERIPAEWNAETVRAMVDGSPDLWATLQELGFTNESWAATLTKDFPAALASVLGVFASTMPERIMDAASRSSEKLVNAVAMAGPAVAALVDAADRSVGLRNADIVGAFADGVELYLRATGDGAKTPEKLAAYGDEIRRQYAALSGAKVLPVSQMSFAIAAAVQRLVSPVNASGTGLASLFRDAAREVDDAMRPSMFAAPKDPVAALVNALTGDVDAVTAAREPFPATHGEAWEYARQLEVAAIEANQAMKPVVVEPPGFVDVLKHSRDYTESLSPPTPKGMPRGPIPVGAYVTSVDPGIDSAPWFEAGKGTPYGIKVSRMRATMEADPVALKLSLGYGPNQTVFGARDFAERLLAKAIVAPLQSTAWRGDYRATPGRIAIPRQRLAAVRARVMVVLGDLPNEVAEAMRTRATPAATPMLGEHLVTPIGLSHESATKIRAILDYLEATGWSSSMGDHIRAMTVSEIQEKLTQPEYVEIVGAVHDSVSGAAPFRQRPDQFSLASNLLWYWFQRPGALLTTAPLSEDSTAWERVLNKAAGVMSGAVLNIDYHINAGGSWAPDMPAHIRPIFDRYRRDIGSMPTRLVEAIEAAVGAKGPGALVAAIRSIQSELPGFVPLLGVVPNPANPGKMSDLAALRGWLYEPHTGGSFTAGQTFAPHDKPRVTPMNWQEVYQHTDLLVSVLSGNGRRRMDGDTIRLIEGLRNRSLTTLEGAEVVGRAWSAMHHAERVGMNILTSAAGQSGAKGAVETILTSEEGRRRFGGLAVDAYEKFYTGVWASNPDPKAPHDSIEDMVVAIGNFKAVQTHLWLSEAINRLNIEAKTEEFIDDLVDHNYVHDITQMATAAGAKPNNRMHAVMLSREVADAVSADLWGTEYVSGVRDGANVNEVLMGYEGLSSPEAKGAARVVIAQSGLRPDLLAIRKGIKGEMPHSGMSDALARLSSDPVEFAKQLANPQTWTSLYSNATPGGRSYFISSTMAEQIAGLVERHAPIGKHLAAILSQRNGVQFVKETLLEGMQLLKGTMITGGTNGVLAAAVAAGALYGGAPILGAVALGGAMWALAAPPRLSGYANNSLGAIMQGAIELGWGTALRTVGDPRIARLAYKASWETVQYRKMGKAVEATGKAVEALRNMLLGKPAAPENMVIISPDGTVWSIADIVRGATQYGLDGTQARFESSERIAHSYDRMAARYEASAANRYTWGLITTFFGRYTLNENYRRMYEHVDTYFRYMWLIRGLQEGLPFDQAVKRSLRISFDYTETAEVDRAINHVFLFWMYQRRALDLTMAALIEHPETVLGMIRYMRAQDLTSGYSDTDDDYVRQTETIPEYVMSRPALPGVAWLPVANVDNSAIKPMLVEPPQVTALRVLNDFGSLNLMSLIGRTNPVGQFAVNTAMAMSGGEMISFFRKRPVADSDYVIPNRLMMWDQQVTNGAFARSFGARAYYIEDPQRRAVDGYPFEWRVGESSSNRLAYDAFRSLVAGAGPLLTSMDVSDKSDNYTDKATLWLLQHMEPPPIDGTFHPAVDEHARPSVGRLMEGLRSYGLGLGTVRSVYASRQQPQKDLAASVAAALAQTEAENRAANPPEVRAPNLGPERVDADKRIGVTPDKAIGVEK